MATRKSTAKPQAQTGAFVHTDAKAIIRPEVGVQSHAAAKPKFRREPATYRYDSSLAPELQWDALNPGREQGEALITRIAELTRALGAASGEVERAALAAQLLQAADALQALSRPFLNWAGKAERVSFDVPTLPLFIHERLSTTAILETLKGHRASRQMDWLNDLFGNPDRPLWEQLAKSYEHANGWSNRLILGDSLVVMNSLLQFERLRGEVQMIYMDPPYGVKFGSNFQPFVRKRDVTHNDDADLTREPEMVKAYRDTWELGLHSYLTYLRDRLLLSRELLADSGSIFVQISDENLHHVREVMDEVFGAENFCAIINFRKTSGASSPFAKTNVVGAVSDFILWYAKDFEGIRYRQLYVERLWEPGSPYRLVELHDGSRRRMTPAEAKGEAELPESARAFRLDQLSNQSIIPSCIYPLELEGRTFQPPIGRHWATTPHGMKRLLELRRVGLSGNTPSYVRYHNDFSFSPMSSWWTTLAWEVL